MSYGGRMVAAIADRAVVFVSAVAVMGPAAYCMLPSPPASTPGDPVIAAVTTRLMQEEGFRAHAYEDSVGVLTIGYGTNLAQGITEPQGACLLRLAATADLQTFGTLWPPYGAMLFPVQVELADMAYQLGAHGLLAFHDMLAALERGDYEAAIAAANDSAWARETPARAERAATVFRAQR